MDKNTKTLLVVGVIVLVIGLVIYFCNKKEKYTNENFTHAASLDAPPSYDNNYQLIESPDEVVPVENFADVIDDGNLAAIAKQPQNMSDVNRPLKRLERMETRDMLPRTAASVTPYQVDVANMSTWAYAVNAPRVNLGLDRLAKQADPIRGDIPITYHPDVALIGKSSYGRDSQRLDGTFSDHFAELYNKYTMRGYKNMPMKISTQGTIMDYTA